MSERLARAFRVGVLVATLATSANAFAAPVAWMTDAAVGSNQMTVTISVACTGPAFPCGAFPYLDSAVSSLSGSGTGDLADGGSFAFDLADASPLGAAWTLLAGPFALAEIPAIGVPSFVSGLIAGTSGGPLGAPGFALGSGLGVALGGSLDIGGTLDSATSFPDILAPASPVGVSGLIVDVPGGFEIRDLVGVFGFATVLTTLGADLAVAGTVEVVLNLSGQPLPEPSAGALVAVGLLAFACAAVFRQWARPTL